MSDGLDRWNAPEAGTIQGIYVWADDTVPTSAGTYTISAASAGNPIFSGFDLKSLTLATQTSVGTLTNATLAAGAEVEFTIASNNADLAGAGMRLQIVFLAATAALPARAAVVNTGEYLAAARAEQSLGAAGAALARADVQAQLTALGVDPQDARARVAALSPAELAQLNARLDELPAGSSVLGLIGAVFVVLLILELVGVTDVFSGV